MNTNIQESYTLQPESKLGIRKETHLEFEGEQIRINVREGA
jgi:hypothetical protein